MGFSPIQEFSISVMRGGTGLKSNRMSCSRERFFRERLYFTEKVLYDLWYAKNKAVKTGLILKGSWNDD